MTRCPTFSSFPAWGGAEASLWQFKRRLQAKILMTLQQNNAPDPEDPGAQEPLPSPNSGEAESSAWQEEGKTPSPSPRPGS